MNKKYLGLILVALFISAFTLVSVVKANPPTFLRINSTATATTTLIYMTPGTATTTLVYDAYKFDGTSEVNGSLFFNLAIQLKASSTATVLVTKFEFSNDGVDWYENNLNTYAAGAIAIVVPNSYTWTYASTTVGGAAIGASEDRGTKIISVPVPTRYVRAVFSLTGASGGIWAEALGIKQR